MSDIQWFWEQDGQQAGPASEAELRAKFESGELDGNTLVWHEGLSDWVTASSVGIAKGESSPPPVPSPSGSAATGGHLVPVIDPVAEAPVRPAKLRDDFRPRIRSTFGRAWELFKTDFWPFVGAFALVSLITGVAAQLYVTIFFLLYPIMAGLNWYILNKKRGNPATIDALFFGFKRRFGDLAILNLVLTLPITIFVVLAIFVGVFIMAAVAESVGSDEVAVFMLIGFTIVITILFLIPLFILYAVGTFAMTLILDCDITWKEALSLGWKATKPHIGKLILFGFLYSFVTQLGLLALYFGIFITGAWASIAFIFLYEDAFGDEKAA